VRGASLRRTMLHLLITAPPSASPPQLAASFIFIAQKARRLAHLFSPQRNESAPQRLDCIRRQFPMGETEKTQAPNDKKQTRPVPPKTSPVGLGEGLESPRSPQKRTLTLQARPPCDTWLRITPVCSGTLTMDRSWTPKAKKVRMQSRLYLSILAVASLLGSTLIASAQGPANSAGSTESVPGTSTPVDPGPIVESDPSGRSMP
jgi:hypothetical protein